jgi:hypothetical protein
MCASLSWISVPQEGSALEPEAKRLRLAPASDIAGCDDHREGAPVNAEADDKADADGDGDDAAESSSSSEEDEDEEEALSALRQATSINEYAEIFGHPSVVIDHVPGKGRVLRTTEAITSGDRILVEPAWATVCEDDVGEAEGPER